MMKRSTDAGLARQSHAPLGATLAALILFIINGTAWTASQAAELKNMVVAASAQVSGIVSVAGMSRSPKPLPVFKNRTFCGATVANETMLIGHAGGLRNAVVLLRPRDGKAVTAPGLAVLDNKNCAFSPHVQVVTVGTQLLLKNSDPILHTARARLRKETLFNVGLPRWRQVTKSLDRPGVVRIDCDVLHTWMTAAIVVADTPYFAVTDQEGRFAIPGLPPGGYEMEVWHERLGTKHLPLLLSAGDLASIVVVFAAQ